MPLSREQCCVLLAMLLAALNAWLHLGFFVDDAFITLRYAANFAHGNGPVWNTGEPVEGYSSPLFTALVALCMHLGIKALMAAKTLSFAAYLGLVAVTMHQLRDALRDTKFAAPAFAIGISLLISSAPLMLWALSGMEMVPFALLVAASVGQTCLLLAQPNAAEKKYLALGFTLALTALVRPEGNLIALISIGMLGLRARMRQLPPLLLGWVLPVALHALWRHHYYGDWLPNTYYAKLSGELTMTHFHHGMSYLMQYLTMPPFAVILWPLAAGAMLLRERTQWQGVYLTLLFAAYAAYVVYTGGDWMAGHRFLIPMIPVLSWAVTLAIPSALEAAKKEARRLAGWLLLFTACSMGAQAYLYRDTGLDRYTIYLHAIAGYIGEHWPKDSLIALNMAGQIPYETPDMRYIDMLGLNDRHIAHRQMKLGEDHYIGHYKGDGAYVFARKPDFIIAGDGSTEIDNKTYISESELMALPAFRSTYARREVTIPLSDPRIPAWEMSFIYYQRRGR